MSNQVNDELFERAGSLIEVLSVGDAKELNEVVESNDLELLEALITFHERKLRRKVIEVEEVY